MIVSGHETDLWPAGTHTAPARGCEALSFLPQDNCQAILRLPLLDALFMKKRAASLWGGREHSSGATVHGRWVGSPFVLPLWTANIFKKGFKIEIRLANARGG